jgi:hypothetical protein
MARRNVRFVRIAVQLAACTFHKGDSLVKSGFKFTPPSNGGFDVRENIPVLFHTFADQCTTGSRLFLIWARVEPEEDSAPILMRNSGECQKDFWRTPFWEECGSAKRQKRHGPPKLLPRVRLSVRWLYLTVQGGIPPFAATGLG